jgi:hypothetical protein
LQGTEEKKKSLQNFAHSEMGIGNNRGVAQWGVVASTIVATQQRAAGNNVYPRQEEHE